MWLLSDLLLTQTANGDWLMIVSQLQKQMQNLIFWLNQISCLLLLCNIMILIILIFLCVFQQKLLKCISVLQKILIRGKLIYSLWQYCLKECLKYYLLILFSITNFMRVFQHRMKNCDPKVMQHDEKIMWASIQDVLQPKSQEGILFPQWTIIIR